MKSRALMRAAAAASAVAGVAVFAPTAGATVAAPQVVAGTTLAQLSLTAGTVGAFTSFQAGNSDTQNTAAATLAAIDTTSAWTLTVQDTTGDGHMKATTANPACSGSEAELASPLETTVTAGSLPSGATSSGKVDIPGHTASAATVASATSALLANTLNVTYGQTISATEPLTALCPYTMTATYTLQ